MNVGYPVFPGAGRMRRRGGGGKTIEKQGGREGEGEKVGTKSQDCEPWFCLQGANCVHG